MKTLNLLPRPLRNAFASMGSVLCLALAGCGGGGGGVSMSSTPPPGPTVPAIGEMTLLAGSVGGIGTTDGTPGRFNRPSGLATDASGNVYIADTSNHTIRKITSAGVTTLAGKPGIAGSTDGIGNAVSFNAPVAVAVDLAGNVYVADQGNGVVRKMTPGGLVTTIAGTAGVFGGVDGTGPAARLSALMGITTDANGTVFVAEQNQVRKITPAGMVSTLATGFNGLSSIAVDGVGNVYVVDSFASLIRKISPVGVVTTFAGTATTTNGTAPFGFADGGLGVAKFDHPAGIAAQSDGTLYVLDNSRIRKVTLSGVVATLPINNADGTPFIFPGDQSAGVAVSSDGSLFVASPSANVIRKVAPNLSVINAAGVSVASGNADGTGGAATFSGPGDLAVDAGGNVIVVDALNNAIRKITPSGVVTTVASNVGRKSATSADVSPTFLLGLAIDKSGALFVADPNLHVIRRIGVDGSMTIVAGSTWPDGVNTCGFCGFLEGRSKPVGVAVDSTGALFVPDGAIIRKIAAGGADTVLACTNLPTCVATGKVVEAITTDKADNIYVAQAGVIFKITPTGMSTILASSGPAKFADGVSTVAGFGPIKALVADGAGNIFAVDTSNNAVRKITPAGVVTTIAGAVGAVGVILGMLPASLSAPSGIAMDASGMIYVSSENAVLKIKP